MMSEELAEEASGDLTPRMAFPDEIEEGQRLATALLEAEFVSGEERDVAERVLANGSTCDLEDVERLREIMEAREREEALRALR